MTSELDRALGSAEIVDLTQPLGASTPLWPGSRPIRLTTTATVARDGFFARDLDVPEHAGTHLDAPAHFAPAGAQVADIPVTCLVAPAAVLDVRGVVGDDPDCAVGADAIRRIERVDGPVPSGSVALVRTGWDRHRDHPDRYVGRDRPRCPGIDVDAAALIVERGAVGVGIDTLGIDPGVRTACPAHRVTLPAGLWHLEGLVGLGRLPVRGAWIVVGVIPLVGGSGAPARVLGLVPAGLSRTGPRDPPGEGV